MTPETILARAVELEAAGFSPLAASDIAEAEAESAADALAHDMAVHIIAISRREA